MGESDAQISNSSRGKITAVLRDIVFSSDFDSGNLDRVEECKSTSTGTRDFNLWIAPDCAGSPHENGCRTWFYFSVTTPPNYSGTTLRFNIQNMNKQCRLYQQGLTPITKKVPGRGTWERMRERPEYQTSEGNGFKLSFQTTITDTRRLTSYFAFCFPFSYSECQRLLIKLDGIHGAKSDAASGDHQPDDIYYHRDLVCYSLERRCVDLITVSSYSGITGANEPHLPGLFPDASAERAFSFKGKRVIFVSSRVHPGETPSSHVFNGFLQFILRRDDVRAQSLRHHFVFKLIPMLNPDGVCRGHYRTDTLGMNLNRVYMDPTLESHPSIYAARSLLIHFHHNYRVDASLPHSQHSVELSTVSQIDNRHLGNPDASSLCVLPSEGRTVCPQGNDSCGLEQKSSIACCNLMMDSSPGRGDMTSLSATVQSDDTHLSGSANPTGSLTALDESRDSIDAISIGKSSGIAFYVDLHAHATKRGCFIYGNHFSNVSEQAENMLLPKLVSLNSPHLDFDQCVFSERNMYTSDKRDGMSKEGSGRVAMYKTIGIIHSYTLECNYNSGRQLNMTSEATLDDGRATPPCPGSTMPHKFSIQDYEQVGHALAVAALDLYQINPCSRLPNTNFKNLTGVRESLLAKLTNTASRRFTTVFTKQSGQDLLPLAYGAKTAAVRQASKRLLLKGQRCHEIASGPGHVAFNINFVTKTKQTGRKRNTSKPISSLSGKTTARQPDSQTHFLKQEDLPSGPHHLKASVQEVKFPSRGLLPDENSVCLTKPKPAPRTGTITNHRPMGFQKSPENNTAILPNGLSTPQKS